MREKRSMVVSIIGRPNVGKSSIYNRLMKRAHKNITYDLPGVTRDRHYGICRLNELSDDQGMEIILIDTGGFYPEKVSEERGDDKFFNIMIEHAKTAISESDLVLLVVDVREGLVPFDHGIVNYLRAVKKDFWLLVNKYDSDKQAGHEGEFFQLGIDSDDMHVVSAAHGLGIQTLLQRLHRSAMNFSSLLVEDEAPKLQKGVTPRENVVAKLAIVGAPNSGKSTLLNSLIGSERALVSDVPGTTVDPIEGFFDIYMGANAFEADHDYTYGDSRDLLIQSYEEFQKNNSDFHQVMLKQYQEDFDPENFDEEGPFSDDTIVSEENEDNLYSSVFDSDLAQDCVEEEQPSKNYWRTIHVVDTAGIRRQKSVKGFIEEQSVYRSLRSITEADIVLFLMDATKGIGHQDRRLMDISIEKGKSLILCMNKIDLLAKKLDSKTKRQEWLKDLRSQVPWLNYCEVVSVSAKYGQHLNRLKKVIRDTIYVRKRRIPTSQLNRVVFDLVEKNPVVIENSHGRRLKVKYSSMIKSGPPTFLLYTNRSRGIPEHYRRYLKNGIRRELGLHNTPVHLIFRTGSDLEKRLRDRQKHS